MYVLMGANGNITAKAAQQLLQQGEKVRVIGRSANNLKDLQAAGAEIAIADAGDAAALARAFAGATAVYTMIPPNYGASDFRAWQNSIGSAIATALRAAGVTRVINLSSIGAHHDGGTGPIAGLHDQEVRLNALPGIDLLHVRAGYFFENHFNALGGIVAQGVYADMIAGDVPIASVATADIAAVVARELRRTRGTGSRVLHLHAAPVTQQQAAAILGAAIGKPSLPHVQADPAVVVPILQGHGFSADVARLFAEMSAAISRADWFYPADVAGARELAPTTLQQWAPQFAQAYAALQGAKQAA